MTVSDPIQPAELNTPHLNLPERQALLLALNTQYFGLGEVTVAFIYDKQTETKPRLGGQDYIPIPGCDPRVQVGQITYVSRRQTDGGVYFRVASMTRGDGQNPRGFTNVRPEGVHQFVITGFQPFETVTPQVAQ